MSKGPRRRAQLRRSSTELDGRRARPGRILLAQRQLSPTNWDGEVNLWGELVEVRCYEATGKSYQLVLPAYMLGELAAFAGSAVDAMGHKPPGMVGSTLIELVPPRVMPDGSRLIAHGVVTHAGDLPVGLAIGQYLIGKDRTIQPVVIAGAEQLIGLHKAGAGAAALASLFAEAVAAATITPAGRA